MIKIFKYTPQDLTGFVVNHYSRRLKNKKNLAAVKVFLNQAHSFTLFDTTHNRAVAVLSFVEYQPHCFNGCIIASRYFADNPKFAAKMRFLIGRLKVDFAAVRIETISEDMPQLNKWHQFLGFKNEKKLPGYLFGRDYILWSM